MSSDRAVWRKAVRAWAGVLAGDVHLGGEVPPPGQGDKLQGDVPPLQLA